jgi:hypothetical protein
MDEAMNWLRNNEVKPGDVVDVLGALYHDDFRRPDAEVNMSPAEKKKATDDAMSWLRNNDPFGRR